MTLRWLFFSFQGRINRAIWWGVTAGLIAVSMTVFFLTFEQESSTLATISSLAIFALQISPDVKRLHDRNKSGHWLWLYYGLPNLLAIFVFDDFSGLMAAITLVILGVAIWALVDLGFLRGTTGDNRFGPDPLAAKRSRRDGI